MPMKNPSHPGRTVNDACLDPLRLGVLDGHTGISPEMAIRMEKVGGSNADHQF